MNDVDAADPLTAINDPTFLFGLQLLMSLFLAAYSPSEALQTTDVDLSAAAQNVANLKGRIVVLKGKFQVFFKRTVRRSAT
jgi:hypothetical protein